MPSMRTVFRAVVMVVVGAAIVKGWQMYGPPTDKVKAAATQVLEFVQAKIQSQPATAKGAPDPRLVAPSASGAVNPAPTGATLVPPMALNTTPMAGAEAPRLLAGNSSAPAILPNPPAEAGAPGSPGLAGASADRAKELISQLQQRGAQQANLAPWGDGKQYRFSCRAPLASAPLMTQHFESISSDPAAAVQEVMTKVEAWQVAQRDGARRY